MIDGTHPTTLDGYIALDESVMLARAGADVHRPRFHFVAPAGWLNDPNGLSHRDGVYHLFYQYNPYAPVHERIHWGHATSRDLVRWTDEPVALAPGGGGPDSDGCWSGVLVDDGGTPTVIYSGRHGGNELPCVATGSADLRTWTPDPYNPAIATPPPGVDVVAFRDHCVWREGHRWRQLVGSGVRGVGGTAFLYESTDLRSWSLVGPLLVGDAADRAPSDEQPNDVDPSWTGSMWECIDLFRVDAAGRTAPPGTDLPRGADVLVFSAWHEGVTHHPLYWTGTYHGDTFAPEGLHRLDLGGRYFYAPQSMQDEAGRRVLFGWLQEGRPDAAVLAAGWSGVMSLPRVVTLTSAGTLHQEPAPEVAALRHGRVDLAPFSLDAGVERVLEEVRGDQLDIELDLLLTPGATARLALRVGGRERTVLEISHVDRSGRLVAAVRLDRTASSIDPAVDATERGGDAPMSADGRVRVRAVVDHSALELFVNGVPLAARVYPVARDAVGVTVAAAGGGVEVERFAAWTMADAWDGGTRVLWPAP